MILIKKQNYAFLFPLEQYYKVINSNNVKLSYKHSR